MSDQKTILLVEDNPDDEVLTLRALGKLDSGLKIVVARDGVEALEYLLATGEQNGKAPVRPVFVLLDLKLPRKNGLEVLKEARTHERTRAIPIVILTSSDEPSDIAQGYLLGANSYVRKPVDFTQYQGVVAQLGSYWSEINERPR